MSDVLEHNMRSYNAEAERAYMHQFRHMRRAEVAIELIKEVLPDGKEKKLLSVACSSGVFEEKMIKKLGVEVYGIDAAEEALVEAEKRGVHTTKGDISEKLPYPDAMFDVVFAGEVVEHLIDIRAILNEINRVLKPGGYVVLTTPNLARIDDRFKFLFGKAPRHTSPLHPYLYLHIRPFTWGSLRESLEECGFTDCVLRTHAITIDTKWKVHEFFSKKLTRLFPSFGSTLIVRAQKKHHAQSRHVTHRI